MKTSSCTYLSLQQYISIVVVFILSLCSLSSIAQMPASMVRQTDYDTEAIIQQFEFTQQQRPEVYAIVKKKNNDILSIEMLQQKQPDKYFKKLKHIHEGMLQSLVLIMNEDQKKIYNELQVEKRKEKSKIARKNK